MLANIKKYQALIIFILASLLWYLPSWQYGVVHDFLGWILKYEEGNFGDIIHCFGYNGLHQVFHFFNYSFYLLLGVNPFAWYVLFAILHGLNAYLLFTLFKRLRSRWHFELKGAEWYVALLFLISPYQLETISWYACLHYLMSTLALFWGFIEMINYLETKNRGSLLRLHLVFLLSLFVLEINLSAPFIYLAFIIADAFILSKESELKSKIRNVFLVQLSMVIFYFLLNKIILGDWVGHYGVERHFGTDSSGWIEHGLAYFTAFLTMADMFEYESRQAIYQFVMNSPGSYLIISILVLVAAYIFSRIKHWSKEVQLSSLALVMFFMAIVPILTLYYYYITPYQNDRYSYYASGFFFLSLVSIVYLLPRNWRHIFLILYLIINASLSHKMVIDASKAAEGMHYMMQNLPCDEMAGKDVFLLGLPENYRGNYFFGDYSDNAEVMNEFRSLYYLDTTCSDAKSWTNPVQYNLNYPTDGLGAHFVDDQSIKVFIKQGGTWFIRNGIGLLDYENDLYSVENHGWYYLLKLKAKNPNAVYYVPNGAEWSLVE